MDDFKKLQWACRRGMLELDIMLKPFLDEQYKFLSLSEQHTFIKLLDEADQDLFEWLTGKKRCEDQELANMIVQIIHYAQNRQRNL